MGKVFYRFLLYPMLLEMAGVICYRVKGLKNEKIRKILCLGAYGLFFIQSVYVRTFFEGGIYDSFPTSCNAVIYS